VDTYWTLYLIVKHEIVLSIVATHTNYTALVNTQQPTTHTADFNAPYLAWRLQRFGSPRR
jgi:hypothetical protein